MNGKEKFLKAMKTGACKRCCIRHCGVCGDRDELERKYLGGRFPHVAEAPDPSLIIWKNLGKGKIERGCRNVMIFIFAVSLVVLGFLAIIKIYEMNDEYKA